VDFGNPFRKTKEATVDAQPVAGGDVMGLCLIRVAGRARLCRCEVATLPGRQGEQAASEVTAVKGHDKTLS